MQSFLSEGVRIAFIDVPPEGRDRAEPIELVHGFASGARINWVNPQWVQTLTRGEWRATALDNRGPGHRD